MLRFPNCKINIGLYITGKRSDGYHDIETIFYPLPLRDVLEVVRAKETPKMYVSGKTIEGDRDHNLAWLAYKLLQQQFPKNVPAVDIYLHKVIPMGAGLGGGSADGAFMLKLLNDFCKLHLTDAQLADLALQLGSDCPFFIYNTPRFATGRGERMESVAIDLSGYSIQLICPEVHISTQKAFGMLTPKPAPFDLRNLASLPAEKWKERISNDFEESVFKEHPELRHIKNQLYEQGAIYASMSGSGSTIYGIFRSGERASVQSPLVFEEFFL